MIIFAVNGADTKLKLLFSGWPIPVAADFQEVYFCHGITP
jgi:hypothetical protein